MKFLESDLEEIIMKSENEDLYERGLFINGHKKNQLRIGNYGIADIVTYHKEPIPGFKNGVSCLEGWRKVITVFELKKDKISLSTFAQGVEYVKGIRDYLETTGRDVYDYYFRLVLIGRNVDTNSCVVYLPSLLNETIGGMSLELYEYKYNIDGLGFELKEGYSLTNKGF